DISVRLATDVVAAPVSTVVGAARGTVTGVKTIVDPLSEFIDDSDNNAILRVAAVPVAVVGGAVGGAVGAGAGTVEGTVTGIDRIFDDYHHRSAMASEAMDVQQQPPQCQLPDINELLSDLMDQFGASDEDRDDGYLPDLDILLHLRRQQEDAHDEDRELISDHYCSRCYFSSF
ncbi:unnamed protein product, partial [Didymodactylos carnosus]